VVQQALEELDAVRRVRPLDLLAELLPEDGGRAQREAALGDSAVLVVHDDS